MKLEIINDNEIDLIYLISDSTPEFNLPNIKEDCELLMEHKNNLKCLTQNDVEKLFLNNDENYKIYIFPQSPGESYFPVLTHDIFLDEIYNKFSKFVDENLLIDLSYFENNNFYFNLSYHEISRSLKVDINNKFENIEHRIVLNNKSSLNNIEKIKNKLENEYLISIPELNFPNIDKINVDNDFLESLSTSFNNIEFNKEINLSIFEQYESKLNELQERLEKIKL